MLPACMLSFDPGADTGWGVFVPGPSGALDRSARLVSCGLSTAKKPSMPAPGNECTLAPAGGCYGPIRRVVSERPKYYPQSKVPAKDLITLAIRAGMTAGPYAAAGAEVEFFEPWEWKGVVPKDTHHQRLWSKLTPTEQNLVSNAARGIAPSKRHNIMDGIGIGLFALGRVSAGGVS
jgi:hypothetical protein